MEQKSSPDANSHSDQDVPAIHETVVSFPCSQEPHH